MPLLSLSNIANAQRGTIVKRKREAREREREKVCVCICMRSSERFEDGKEGEKGKGRWTPMDIRYPYIPIGGGKGHDDRRWYL